jgi:bifunctional UDP-N-acetylglucosamine pyrophosphorylase/glucosamine-1-phosphate N-acetyltransferase
VNKRKLAVVVMAAGKGTRLKSEFPKVLQPLFGKPLLSRVLDAARTSSVSPSQYCVILGHGRDQVIPVLEAYQATHGVSIETVVQEPQLGTGHAILQARPALEGFDGDVVILSGDAPLLRTESLESFIAAHHEANNDLTVLSAHLEKPFGYGRVMKDGPRILRIVEEKDASPEEKTVQSVNTGIYCLNWKKIEPLLDQLSNQNAQGEFYLTDVIGLAVHRGDKVGFASLDDWTESLGVNSRQDLALCHRLLNERTQDRLMSSGVTILAPEMTFIAPEVEIGSDTTLLPGCTMSGDIKIGKRCQIGPYTTLSGSVCIDDDTKVIQSSVRDSTIGSFTTIGPFAQLRDGAHISHHVLIGNFVEIKKTRIDHHTNASHLAYLGDATLGSDVNIGAGTITANYDPIRDIKSQTHIKDGSKIGSNSVLIAPVTVEENSSVAAGSVITRTVSAGDLAIARGRQTEIKGWVAKTKASIKS